MSRMISMLTAVAVVAIGLWGFWQWFFCRFYVEPEMMAVVIAKQGKPLPPDQILATSGQKGVQAEVLGEGRHFLNPFLFDHVFHPVVRILPGKIGVVTAKVGADLPPGEFLAEPGQKGVWRQVLGPGKYRLNPVGYQVEIADAVNIPIGYVGVMTSMSGKQAPEGEFAGKGQKGVRADVLQPGLYYINPKAVKVDVLEIGVNQVSLLGKQGSAVITKSQIATQNRAMDEMQSIVLQKQAEKREEYFEAESPRPASASPGDSSVRSRGYVSGGWFSRSSSVAEDKSRGDRSKAASPPPRPMKGIGNAETATFVLDQFIEFPSRDGFEISLDMTVELELLPDRLAWIFRSYGDLPAVVEKIIMPQILSVARLKGSAYRAVEFINGEGRERLQHELRDTLARTLAERRIMVHNALIRHVNVPQQILDPIQQSSMAQEQDLTNKERQNTARKQGQLNTELSLIEQRREQVAQETEKIKAEIRADQDKTVAETRAGTLRKSAEIDQQTAKVRAEKVTKLGKAEADVVRMVEGEKARGFQLKAKALGDPMAFNLMEFAGRLNDQVQITILHTGPGTLWTDLEKATMEELGGAKVIKTGK